MVKKMKKLILLQLIGAFTGVCMATEPIHIQEQGYFPIGGKTIQREGVYDNSKFIGWTKQIETGQSYRGDHAFVNYQVPVNPNKLPLVYVHGFGGSGVCWQMTPDGREGFSSLMLRKGWKNFVLDLPGRGRAGRTTTDVEIKPVADEMFWFDIWRLGQCPKYNEGVQFPKGKDALDVFFREMTPDLSDHKEDNLALTALSKRIGPHILVTHSAGGITDWLSAIENAEVKAVASFEPGGFVFPKGEVPPKIDGLTGGVSGKPVSEEQFKRLTQIPIVLYFGDYIPEKVSTKLGDENWRVRLQMARKFVETINRHGGKATIVELPKIGIKGNTHFMMQDLNNDELAALLDKWLKDNNLASK